MVVIDFFSFFLSGFIGSWKVVIVVPCMFIYYEDMNVLSGLSLFYLNMCIS